MQRNSFDGGLKENRREAVRYEKLAINYLGMVKLAMVRRYPAHPAISHRA